MTVRRSKLWQPVPFVDASKYLYQARVRAKEKSGAILFFLVPVMTARVSPGARRTNLKYSSASEVAAALTRRCGASFPQTEQPRSEY